MQPIIRSTSRLECYEGEKWLSLLLKLLNFRKSDGKNKEWMWIEELIYKPRHFGKLREYILNRIEFIKTTNGQ
jgi:hypothetical protein